MSTPINRPSSRSRRYRLLSGLFGSLGVIAVILTNQARNQAGSRTISFETDEGTAMNVDVSPDGKGLVFDILRDIYTVSITGGKARRLVGGTSWDVAPRYSPGGKRVAFVS